MNTKASSERRGYTSRKRQMFSLSWFIMNTTFSKSQKKGRGLFSLGFSRSRIL